VLEEGRRAILAWSRTVDETLLQLTAATPGGLPTPPGKGARSAENAAYLRTLTPEQLALVAGKDGLSADLRDQANRILLDRERADLRNRIAAERAEAKAAVGPGGDARRLTSTRAADELQRKLDALDALSTRIRPRAADDDAGYFLLDYNSAGDGRAVVATHNPDTAANVATFVPGADTDLRTLPGTIDRIDTLHQAAGRSGSPSTSVIAWLDYDSPSGLEVGGNKYANDAAKDLDSFQHGLRTSHVGPESHNTVVGHSYGALVAGTAARQETLPIDDFVSVAGTGAGASHARDLNLPIDHVWATEATADNVADLGRFLGGNRPDPFGDAFEAQQFVSDAPVPLPIDAHSQAFYDHPQNTGLNNLGEIIAGRTPSHR
jgi:hypothetical protein